MSRFIRVQHATGDRFTAARDKDGFFVLGDPRYRSRKHCREAKVRVASETEVIRLLGKGFHLRMIGTRGRSPSLIAPQNIKIEGAPAS